jgi:Fis family transcriptional regulator
MMARTGVSPSASSVRGDANPDVRPLSYHVKQSLERYFAELSGQDPGKLYELVLSEVEQPLLEVVMARTRGNVSKAAEFLGMNRATLRKKLHKYGIAG